MRFQKTNKTEIQCEQNYTEKKYIRREKKKKSHTQDAIYFFSPLIYYDTIVFDDKLLLN